MSSSYIASLASRGRGKIAPATFSHVLQLVRAYRVTSQGPVSVSAAPASAKSPASSGLSASGSRRTRMPSLRSTTQRYWRSYASAQVRDVEDDDDDQLPPLPPVDARPPHRTRPQTSPKSTSSRDRRLKSNTGYYTKPRPFKPPSPRTGDPFDPSDPSNSSDPSDHPSSAPPASQILNPSKRRVLFHRTDRATLPKNLRELLGTRHIYSPTEFRTKMRNGNLNFTALMSRSSLAAVMTIFFRKGSQEDWAWLEEVLRDIGNYLDGKIVHVEEHDPGESCRSAAMTMRAWAMLQLRHFESDEGDKLDLSGVEDTVQEAFSTRLGAVDHFGTKTSRIPAFEHGMAGIVLASLGRYGEARREMLYALRRTSSDYGMLKAHAASGREPRYEESAYELDYFEAYRQVLIAKQAPESILDVFWHSNDGFVFHFRQYKSTRPWFPAQMKYWSGIFLGIPDPTAEVRARLSSDLTIEQLRDRADCMFKGLAYARVLHPLHSRENQSARLDDVTELARFILREGWKPSSDAMGVVLQRLFHLHRPDEAMALFRQCLAAKMEFSHAPHSRVLDGLVASGRLDMAREVQRHIGFTWIPTGLDQNILSNALATTGDASRLMDNFEQTVGEDWHQDPKALEKLQRAYHAANDPESSEAVFEQRARITQSIEPFNDQLAYYARATAVGKAMEILGKIVAAGLWPNSHTYNLLLSMFALLGDVPNAERVIVQMQAQKIEIPAVNWATLLNVYLKVGQFDTVAEKYSKLPESIQKDRAILGVMLRACTRLGTNIRLARRIFRQIKNKGPQDWALMIYCTIENGDMIAAKKLYLEMDHISQMDHTEPKPDIFTFSILLQGYIRASDHISAQEVHEEMLRRQILPSSATYGSIINYFAQARGQEPFDKAHDFAMKILQEVEAGRLSDTGPAKAKAKGSIIGPLIPAALRLPNLRRAQEYDAMLSEVEPPRILRLTQMMDGYRDAGDLASVTRLWKQVLQMACDSTSRAAMVLDAVTSGFGSSPTKPDRSQSNLICIPLSIMIDALAAGGRHAELKEVWATVRDEGFGFDAYNYSHFAAGLARTGDLESAFYVMEHVIIPRWEEIKSRRYKAKRPTKSGHLPLIPPHEVSVLDVQRYGEMVMENVEAVGDQPADAKRKRSYDLENPRPAPENPYAKRLSRANMHSDLISNIVRRYRPMDEAWRPSAVTLSALANASLQIANQRCVDADGNRSVDKRVWLWFLSDREEDDTPSPLDAERQINIHLEGYPRTPIRDPRTGDALIASPKAFLLKLKVKYRKTMMLMLLHYRQKQNLSKRRRRERQRESSARRSGAARRTTGLKRTGRNETSSKRGQEVSGRREQ